MRILFFAVILASLLTGVVTPALADWERDFAAAQKEPDRDRRIKLLLPYAEAGKKEAQVYLGDLYFESERREGYDVHKAREWYLKAARQGDVEGYFTVYPLPYVALTKLQCENVEVQITTTCDAKNDNGRPACPLQKIEFLETATGKSLRSHFFFNPLYKRDDSIATYVGCAKAKTSHVVVGYTNFGSGGTCWNCEWQELYDLSGRMVAASGGLRINKRQSDKLSHHYFQLKRKIGWHVADSDGVNVVRYPDHQVLRLIDEREYAPTIEEGRPANQYDSGCR